MRKLKFHSLNHEAGKTPYLEVSIPDGHPTPRMGEIIQSQHAAFVAKTQFGLPIGDMFQVKGILHSFEKKGSKIEISVLPVSEIEAMMQQSKNGRPPGIKLTKS